MATALKSPYTIPQKSQEPAPSPQSSDSSGWETYFDPSTFAKEPGLPTPKPLPTQKPLREKAPTLPTAADRLPSISPAFTPHPNIHAISGPEKTIPSHMYFPEIPEQERTTFLSTAANDIIRETNNAIGQGRYPIAKNILSIPDLESDEPAIPLDYNGWVSEYKLPRNEDTLNEYKRLAGLYRADKERIKAGQSPTQASTPPFGPSATQDQILRYYKRLNLPTEKSLFEQDEDAGMFNPIRGSFGEGENAYIIPQGRVVDSASISNGSVAHDTAQDVLGGVRDINDSIASFRGDIARDNATYEYVTPNGTVFTEDDMVDTGDGQKDFMSGFVTSSGKFVTKDEVETNGDIDTRWARPGEEPYGYTTGEDGKTYGYVYDIRYNDTWAQDLIPASALKDGKTVIAVADMDDNGDWNFDFSGISSRQSNGDWSGGLAKVNPRAPWEQGLDFLSPEKSETVGWLADLFGYSLPYFVPVYREASALGRSDAASRGYDGDSYDRATGTYADTYMQPNSKGAAMLSPWIDVLAEGLSSGVMGSIPKRLTSPKNSFLGRHPIVASSAIEGVEEIPSAFADIAARDGLGSNYGASRVYDPNSGQYIYVNTNLSKRLQNIAGEVGNAFGSGAAMGGVMGSPQSALRKALGALNDGRPVLQSLQSAPQETEEKDANKEQH